MARALSQILQELNGVYQPQKDNYNAQIASLDPQMQADQSGLEAQKTDSFNQIQSGANRRGLNFSGIPLQEQATYTGQTFLPAVANLKAKYAQQRFNLQDAIAKITQDQYLKGQDIYQTELNRDLQAEAARAAARASAGGLASPSFGGGGGGGAAPRAPTIQDQAYQSVQKFLGQGDRAAMSDYNATAESARRGNAMDKLKLQLYQSSRPDLFRNGVYQSGGTSQSSGQLRVNNSGGSLPSF